MKHTVARIFTSSCLASDSSVSEVCSLSTASSRSRRALVASATARATSSRLCFSTSANYIGISSIAPLIQYFLRTASCTDFDRLANDSARKLDALVGAMVAVREYADAAATRWTWNGLRSNSGF